MSGPPQPAEALFRRLAPFYGDDKATTEAVLAGVVEAFNETTGRALDPANLSLEERADLRLWLVETTLSDGDEFAGCASLTYGRRRLEHLPLFCDMAAKVSWLAQHRCPTCPPATPPRIFPNGGPALVTSSRA